MNDQFWVAGRKKLSVKVKLKKLAFKSKFNHLIWDWLTKLDLRKKGSYLPKFSITFNSNQRKLGKNRLLKTATPSHHIPAHMMIFNEVGCTSHKTLINVLLFAHHRAKILSRKTRLCLLKTGLLFPWPFPHTQCALAPFSFTPSSSLAILQHKPLCTYPHG